MTPKPLYITTAINYPNGRPHIGHAYEEIATDAIARFHRLSGREVRFQTGVDEHGLKMVQTAREQDRNVRDLGDEMTSYFIEMCEKLNISYDRFIRTTEPAHHDASQALWKAMEARGDLYTDTYQGWYSVRDEAYYDESELIEGEGGEKLSPQGTAVEWTVEETWFFRLSKYQDKLLELYAKQPDFIQPDSRRNEMVRFVEGGLRDLSVSRTSFDWGVKVPGHEDHVMYVWVDALTNYITGLGYPDETAENYRKYWGEGAEAVHIIGKDIVRFHTVYWPAFLMSAGLPLPSRVFGHGFLLNKGQKESKSIGNVTNPVALAESHGVDSLRFYLLDTVSFGQDGSYSDFGIVECNNAVMAGTFGNLLQRVLAFISRRMNGVAPALSENKAVDDQLEEQIVRTYARWMAAMHNFEISRATAQCELAAIECNRYVDEVAPWKTIKEDSIRAEHTLATLIVAQIKIWLLMSPFTPSLAAKALEQLNVPEELRGRLDWDIKAWYVQNQAQLRFDSPTPLVQVFDLA